VSNAGHIDLQVGQVAGVRAGRIVKAVLVAKRVVVPAGECPVVLGRMS